LLTRAARSADTHIRATTVREWTPRKIDFFTGSQQRVEHRPLPPRVAGERVHWLLHRTSSPLFPFPRPPPADGGKGREGGARTFGGRTRFTRGTRPRGSHAWASTQSFHPPLPCYSWKGCSRCGACSGVSTLCADGNAVRPLAEASLPLPPERRYSDGNTGVTT